MTDVLWQKHGAKSGIEEKSCQSDKFVVRTEPPGNPKSSPASEVVSNLALLTIPIGLVNLTSAVFGK